MRTKQIDDQTIVIYMDGRLDMAFLKGGLEDEFMSVIKQSKWQEVIVDLSNVEYVSSTGLRVLINALRILSDRPGGELKISHMNTEVAKIFNAAQVANLFNVFETTEEALKV